MENFESPNDRRMRESLEDGEVSGLSAVDLFMTAIALMFVSFCAIVAIAGLISLVISFFS